MEFSKGDANTMVGHGTWIRLTTLVLGGLSVAQLPADDGIAFFETRIRPVLVKSCYKCHSAAAARIHGKLRVDSRPGLRTGGESGPAVVPGRLDQSLLLDAIRYQSLEMPPKKKLPDDVIADFEAWVKMGAPDPRDDPPSAKTAAQESWRSLVKERSRWWSLQRVAEVSPPDVSDNGWSEQPIDRFVLRGLLKSGLRPAGAADPSTLIRRLSFLLTGLPPTREWVRDFEKDSERDAAWAVTRLVNRLLASPQFGERFARHWMDVVRYTDTYGYEWDIPAKGAWRYRDYLVRAYNADIGFDQMAREQLAGDLLNNPRIDEKSNRNESLVGPMFFHLGEHRHGDSLNFNGIHQEMLNNKIDAFSKAFLATTVACARCHDHKLDAVSQRDYYALASVFTTPRWTSRVIDTPQRHADAIRRLKSLRSDIRQQLSRVWKATAARFADELQLVGENHSGRDESEANTEKRVTAWRRALGLNAQPAPKFAIENIAYPLSRVLAAKDDTLVSEMWKEMSDAWRSESKQRTAWNEKHFQVVMDFRGPELPSGWTMDGDGIRQGFVADGTPLVARAGESAVQQLLPRGLHTHALSARLPGSLRTPRLQTLGKKYLSVLLAGGEWSGHITIPNNAFLTERVGFLRGADPARWQRFSTFQDRPEAHVRTEIATGNLNPNFPPRTGLARAGSSRLPDEDFGIDKPSWFSITGVVTHDAAEIPKATLECFGTLYGSDVSSQPANGGTPLRSRDDVLSRIAMWFTGAVDRWVAGDSLAGDVLIVNWLLEQKLLPNMLSEDERLAELVTEYRRVASEISPARTVNSLDESGREAVTYRRNIRGNVDELGEAIAPGFLDVFSDRHRVGSAPGSGRRELAEFVVDDSNPLTARVYVNRVWGWLFGRGLVATPNDFGHLGQKPTHPELLDYLAREFVRDGWSTKRLIRRIVLSRTFQQSHRVLASARERDPNNRLLHHYPTRRLEAEAIRDAILAVSGRLDPALFGRAIEPPRTRIDTAKRLFSGPLDGAGRRSIYMRMTIMDPPKLLAVFNQPAPKIPTGVRDVTNVPSQALVLLNDPFVADQAVDWGLRLVRGQETDVGERIQRMFRRAYGRSATSNEIALWSEAVDNLAQLTMPGKHPDISQVLTHTAVWTNIAHAMFNSKEFIYYR